jgi:hypothetical protein
MLEVPFQPQYVFQFTIPINDYYGKSVFFQEIYFIGEQCPTMEEVKNQLKKMADEEEKEAIEHPEFGPYLHCWQECLEILSLVKEFPKLSPHYICQNNTHVNHPKHGMQPLTAKIITIHAIPKE